jgi:hypothetical protein
MKARGKSGLSLAARSTVASPIVCIARSRLRFLLLLSPSLPSSSFSPCSDRENKTRASHHATPMVVAMGISLRFIIMRYAGQTGSVGSSIRWTGPPSLNLANLSLLLADAHRSGGTLVCNPSCFAVSRTRSLRRPRVPRYLRAAAYERHDAPSHRVSYAGAISWTDTGPAPMIERTRTKNDSSTGQIQAWRGHRETKGSTTDLCTPSFHTPARE